LDGRYAWLRRRCDRRIYGLLRDHFAFSCAGRNFCACTRISVTRLRRCIHTRNTVWHCRSHAPRTRCLHTAPAISARLPYLPHPQCHHLHVAAVCPSADAALLTATSAPYRPTLLPRSAFAGQRDHLRWTFSPPHQVSAARAFAAWRHSTASLAATPLPHFLCGIPSTCTL